jgi:hypothetical protein
MRHLRQGGRCKQGGGTGEQGAAVHCGSSAIVPAAFARCPETSGGNDRDDRPVRMHSRQGASMVHATRRMQAGAMARKQRACHEECSRNGARAPERSRDEAARRWAGAPWASTAADGIPQDHDGIDLRAATT